MQKFKVKRKDFIEAIMAGWSGDVILEGELLEDGGTVEKCCLGCLNGALIKEPWCGNKMCNCHKVEKCNHHRIFGQPCDICHNKKVDAHFNRETPIRINTDCFCPKDDKCRHRVSKEEVKLPEKLPEFSVFNQRLPDVEDKINEIIDYLKSKENK